MVSTTPQDDRGTKRDALVGGVDEVAVTADLDDMGRSEGSTDGQESGSERGRTHMRSTLPFVLRECRPSAANWGARLRRGPSRIEDAMAGLYPGRYADCSRTSCRQGVERAAPRRCANATRWCDSPRLLGCPKTSDLRDIANIAVWGEK